MTELNKVSSDDDSQVSESHCNQHRMISYW